MRRSPFGSARRLTSVVVVPIVAILGQVQTIISHQLRRGDTCEQPAQFLRVGGGRVWANIQINGIFPNKAVRLEAICFGIGAASPSLLQ